MTHTRRACYAYGLAGEVGLETPCPREARRSGGFGPRSSTDSRLGAFHLARRAPEALTDIVMREIHKMADAAGAVAAAEGWPRCT